MSDASVTGGWDALEARVAGAVMADHRRAWFRSLIGQGRAAEADGRPALAAHCRTRAEAELTAAFGPAGPPPAPVSARTSPLGELRARREAAARTRALELLARHGERLSPPERASFRAALDEAPDSRIPGLRRRLVDRLLRAARYRRQGARLAAWTAAVPGSGSAPHLPEVPQSEALPSGPYNDYRALEDMLRRVASAHPDWAAEFLDVYAEMRAVRRAYGGLLPGK
jgi:hypothetical protein